MVGPVQSKNVVPFSPDIRYVKHDVNGRRQTANGKVAKMTSDFEFFSSNP